LAAGLEKYLPKGVTFEVPQGGYFCVVRLPDGNNAKDLLPVALEHKVQYLPGSAFSQTMDQFCRLSFSYYSAEDLGLAAKRLGEAIEDFLSKGSAKKLKQ
jgi:DNA-binding transcriptional MocR family regulator